MLYQSTREAPRFLRRFDFRARLQETSPVARETLGLLGYDSFHFAVEKSDRSRDFYVNKFDFREVARSGEELTARSGQESTVVAAGDVRVVVSKALRPTS